MKDKRVKINDNPSDRNKILDNDPKDEPKKKHLELPLCCWMSLLHPVNDTEWHYYASSASGYIL